MPPPKSSASPSLTVPATPSPRLPVGNVGHARGREVWEALDVLGPDHPVTRSRPVTPAMAAETMKHDPGAAGWWLARADRIAAVLLQGPVAGRFVSVEPVVYRLPGIVVGEALAAFSARRPMVPRESALFPPEVFAAWGRGVSPEDLPALYLATPPHTGFRLLPYGASGWDGPTAYPRPMGSGEPSPYRVLGVEVPRVVPAFLTARDLRGLVRTGFARYLPPGPLGDLTRGGGPLAPGQCPVRRSFGPMPGGAPTPDPADLAGTALDFLAPDSDSDDISLDTRETRLASVHPAWRWYAALWTLNPHPATAKTPEAVTRPGWVDRAPVAYRMRRAVVLRLTEAPVRVGDDVEVRSPPADGDALTPRGSGFDWQATRPSEDGIDPADSLVTEAPHSLGTFLDALGVPPPPGTVPLGAGLAVWIATGTRAAFTRSALASITLARVRALLMDGDAGAGAEALLDTAAAREALDGDALPVSLAAFLRAPLPALPSGVPAPWCFPPHAARAAVEAVEADRGYAEGDTAGSGPAVWGHRDLAGSFVEAAVVAAWAVAGSGPGAALAVLLSALLWPDRPTSRVLRAEYAALGLTGRHWRGVVSEVLRWLDGEGEPRLPLSATGLWWAVQTEAEHVAALGPTEDRHPAWDRVFVGKDRRVIDRYDAAMARDDWRVARGMVRQEHARRYANRAAVRGETAEAPAALWAGWDDED